MAKRKSTFQKRLHSAFSEEKKNPPAILAQTRAKKGAAAANKQRIAIAFSKARAGGKKRR